MKKMIILLILFATVGVCSAKQISGRGFIEVGKLNEKLNIYPITVYIEDKTKPYQKKVLGSYSANGGNYTLDKLKWLNDFGYYVTKDLEKDWVYVANLGKNRKCKLLLIGRSPSPLPLKEYNFDFDMCEDQQIVDIHSLTNACQ